MQPNVCLLIEWSPLNTTLPYTVSIHILALYLQVNFAVNYKTEYDISPLNSTLPYSGSIHILALYLQGNFAVNYKTENEILKHLSTPSSILCYI